MESYRIQHSYVFDKGGPEYKARWSQIFNNARVYTPDDKAIQEALDGKWKAPPLERAS